MIKENKALKIAIEEFNKIPLTSIAEKCNVSLIEDKIKIRYFNRWYLVSPCNITCPQEKKPVPEKEKIIILHYLTSSKGTPLTDKLIDFREIPSGSMYYSSFEARVYQPFLAFFGKNPALFIKAGAALDGERVDFGDIAFKFTVLPGIPITFILHKGDEEFPPAAKVLFDASIKDCLPTEDIAIICEDTVRELKKFPVKFRV